VESGRTGAIEVENEDASIIVQRNIVTSFVGLNPNNDIPLHYY
jgi:hypothetical protein